VWTGHWLPIVVSRAVDRRQRPRCPMRLRERRQLGIRTGDLDVGLEFLAYALDGVVVAPRDHAKDHGHDFVWTVAPRSRWSRSPTAPCSPTPCRAGSPACATVWASSGPRRAAADTGTPRRPAGDERHQRGHRARRQGRRGLPHHVAGRPGRRRRGRQPGAGPGGCSDLPLTARSRRFTRGRWWRARTRRPAAG
jgi:hypothetical protein